jgi:lipid-A-disaccharide synthase
LKEVRLNLPEMLRAASLLQSQDNYEFVLPLAATLTEEQRAQVKAMLSEDPVLPAGLRVTFTSDARATLLHARASVVASGTATVEAALIGNPFVVVYRVSPVSYAVAKRVVDVPHVAMVNLIAGRRAVPELVQGDFTAENVVPHLRPLLEEGEARESMIASLREISGMLKAEDNEGGESAIDRTARITMEVLQENYSREES